MKHSACIRYLNLNKKRPVHQHSVFGAAVRIATFRTAKQIIRGRNGSVYVRTAPLDTY